MTEPKLPPPLRKPTSEYPTPSPVVGFFTEIVDRTDQAYQKNAPVKRGTLYSTINGAKQNVIDAYPLLYFVREQKYGNSDQLCIWIWSTAFDAESSYNAEVDYIGEAVACPAFSRVYNIRRDVYEANPTINPGTSLTAIVGVRITAGGTGYTQATGTVGTGGKVQFVVDANGTIISGIVTAEGSGITSGQSIIITGDGSGATATAIVQPVGAVLTSQKKQELPQDDPLRNEFIRVIRVYQTLPGPALTDYTFDQRYGVPFSVSTTKKQSSGLSGGLTISGSLVTAKEVKAKDANVADEIVTTVTIPAQQVFYGRRRESLPVILASVTLVGTEAIEAVPRYIHPPEGALKARYTRDFSYGPPGEPTDPTLSELLYPQPFNTVVEYSETRASSQITSGTHILAETASGTNSANENSSSNGTRSSAETTASNVTHESDQTTETDGDHTSNETSHHVANATGTHVTDETGTHSASDTGTHTNTESGTHTSSDTGSHTNTDAGTHHSQDVQNGGSNESTTTSSTGAPLVGDPQNNRVTNFTSNRSTDSSSNSNSSGNHTSQSTGSHTNNSSGSHTGSSSGSHASHSSGASSSSNITDSTGSMTSSQSGSGTSSTSGNSSSNGTTNSSGSHSSTLNTSSTGSRNSTTNSNSSTNSNANSTTTAKNLLRVNFPPTMHADIVTTLFTIPATTPPNLPWGQWMTVFENSEHWKNGIWVTEKIEVKLPAQPT